MGAVFHASRNSLSTLSQIHGMFGRQRLASSGLIFKVFLPISLLYGGLFAKLAELRA
jgi:hypothetical protein